jgi:ABC-2 type transport system ATP-binding protein
MTQTQEIAIEVSGLRKRYREREVVRGIDLQVRRGEIFGILGPNGAGKTTTLEILEGIRSRNAGQVDVLGFDPQREGRELRLHIGIQFQATSLQDKLTVREALALYRGFYPEPNRSADRFVKQLELDQVMNQRFGKLSGGWRQRVSLALAVVHDPELVFLDEPSTGLDPAARHGVWDFVVRLKQEGKTVVLTTHYMEEAQTLCDRVAMFAQGQIAAQGSPTELVARLGGQEAIRFVSADADAVVLRALPSVMSVQETDGVYRVRSGDVQQCSLEVFTLARDRGWKIQGFSYETGTLDDLFVGLSNRREEGKSA